MADLARNQADAPHQPPRGLIKVDTVPVITRTLVTTTVLTSALAL